MPANGFLTAREFNANPASKKPGASYGGYVNWVKRTRAKRAAMHATPQAPAPMAAVTAALTPQQQVDASIKASLAGMRASTSAEQAQSNAQAAQAQKYAVALANLTAGTPDAIKADYQQAADRLKGYGAGLTGATFDAQQAAAASVAQHLKDQGVTDTAPSTYDPAALRSTATMLGVTIPGTTLDEESLLAKHAAEADRAASVSRVGDIAQQYLAKTTDLQNQLAAKRTALEATRPQLLQSALTAKSDAARQQRALDVQVGTLQLQQAKTAQDQAIAMTNLTGTLHVVDKTGRVIDTHRSAQGSDAAKTQAQINQADADRRVKQEIASAQADATKSAATTAAAAKVAAAKVAAQNAGNKPATPKQRSDILKNSSAQGGELVKTTVNRIYALTPDTDPIRSGEKPDDFTKRHTQALAIYQHRLQQHRGEIVTRVAGLITPQLKLLHYGPGQIQAMANAIVNAYIPQKG
jgi:hypothetical protein